MFKNKFSRMLVMVMLVMVMTSALIVFNQTAEPTEAGAITVIIDGQYSAASFVRVEPIAEYSHQQNQWGWQELAAGAFVYVTTPSDTFSEGWHTFKIQGVNFSWQGQAHKIQTYLDNQGNTVTKFSSFVRSAQ